MARFFAGEDLAAYRPAGAAVAEQAAALPLQQPERTLLWMINRAYSIERSAAAYKEAD